MKKRKLQKPNSKTQNKNFNVLAYTENGTGCGTNCGTGCGGSCGFKD